MAGSYQHCAADNGGFVFDLIENMGDAHEACEHMFYMIHFLTDGDQEQIRAASDRYYAMVRGEQPNPLPPASE